MTQQVILGCSTLIAFVHSFVIIMGLLLAFHIAEGGRAHPSPSEETWKMMCSVID